MLMRITPLAIASSAKPSFLFFFSSRRRHTRYWRDWEFRRVLFRSGCLSSFSLRVGRWKPIWGKGRCHGNENRYGLAEHDAGRPHFGGLSIERSRFRQPHARSEERRVGKEGRSWWSRRCKKRTRKQA